VTPPRGDRRHRPPIAADGKGAAGTPRLRDLIGVFSYARRALGLVWATSRPVTIALAVGAVVAGALPGAMAWTGKRLIDAVVGAAGTGDADARAAALGWIGLELGLAIALAVTTRITSILRSLLRARLGNRVNAMILAKALDFELTQFEDADTYDRLTRARREASSRPLSMVMRTFAIAQQTITLVGLAALLAAFSPLALAILLAAALPAFIVEAKFSGDAFRLFRWRTPETREQGYLESVLARDDHAKEVQLYQLGPRLLDRYQAIFDRVYGDDRRLAWRRGLWGLGLGVLATAAFYGMYAWIALAAIAGTITIGAMTMYVVVFRQAQASLASVLGDLGGLYEDNLYLSTLYELLDLPTARRTGGVTTGAVPGDGVRFTDVAFTYPGATEPALAGISLHVPPGSKLAIVGENGSGKTTLIKLLAGLYSRPPGGHRRRHAGARLGRRRPAPAHRRHLPGLRPLPAHGRREHRRRATTAPSRTARAGPPPPSKAWPRRWSRPCRPASTPASASGSRTAASCPSGSGRRSRWPAPSCAPTPTSWSSTSRPRRWTPPPRSRSSSASASAPAIRSRS
jgi:ATP-binding cassette subfamily B protein